MYHQGYIITERCTCGWISTACRSAASSLSGCHCLAVSAGAARQKGQTDAFGLFDEPHDPALLTVTVGPFITVLNLQNKPWNNRAVGLYGSDIVVAHWHHLYTCTQGKQMTVYGHSYSNKLHSTALHSLERCLPVSAIALKLG